MSRRTRTAAIGAGAALAVSVCALAAVAHSRPAGDTHAQDKGVILAEGNDRHPSRTARDWVTYADYAVVVTALDDSAIEPDADDPDNPVGDSGPVMRKVRLRVDKILWSKEKPAHEPPKAFDWNAFGWHQDEDGERIEMSGAHEPRIEPGHSYVMALQWQAPQCPPGDDPVPGQWRGLGDESTIPYDQGVLGQGEFEGRTRTAPAAEESALPSADPNFGLRDELVGRSAEDLAAKLGETQPGTPETAGEPADACT
ncbi:hypothetical protein [Streptomyces echinatus]|uniref:hypothetical protein n=1 Tax=Streptomyces echinatus TaxID=67293 RepID=UPI0037B1EB25